MWFSKSGRECTKSVRSARWQDDAWELQFLTTLGERAKHITFAEAQRNLHAFGAMKPYLTAHARPAAPVDRSDDHWRPVDENRDQFRRSRRRGFANVIREVYFLNTNAMHSPCGAPERQKA